ncbi:hypothetical protein ACIBF1_33010 [Spirillospora sp. NPDC050679]
MLLFPAKIVRVLAPGGVLLWLNQLGGDGPLYLPTATETEAGWGIWALFRSTG